MNGESEHGVVAPLVRLDSKGRRDHQIEKTGREKKNYKYCLRLNCCLFLFPLLFYKKIKRNYKIFTPFVIWIFLMLWTGALHVRPKRCLQNYSQHSSLCGIALHGLAFTSPFQIWFVILFLVSNLQT